MRYYFVAILANISFAYQPNVGNICGWRVDLFPAIQTDGEISPESYQGVFDESHDILCESGPSPDQFAFVHGDAAADYFAERQETSGKYQAVFYVGTTTPRKYWRPENTPLEGISMAVIGDLDGITRVTRIGIFR